MGVLVLLLLRGCCACAACVVVDRQGVRAGMYAPALPPHAIFKGLPALCCWVIPLQALPASLEEIFIRLATGQPSCPLLPDREMDIAVAGTRSLTKHRALPLHRQGFSFPGLLLSFIQKAIQLQIHPGSTSLEDLTGR